MKRARATRFSSSATISDPYSLALVRLSPACNASPADLPASVAHIPFDFSVGEITLPAGPYTLTPSAPTGVMTMRPVADTSLQLLVQAINASPDEDPTAGRILFYCRCERYYLAQVLAQTA